MIPSEISLLQEAVARNMGVVLSLPSAGMLRHSKSRFLAEVDQGILIEEPPAEQMLVDAIIIGRQPCGVAFKKDHNKIIFAATIRVRQPDYRFNAETIVNGLLLEFPTEIKSIQRRKDYRVRIMPESDMSVRVWRIGSRAQLRDLPIASSEIKADLRDISVGGVGVVLLGKDGAEPMITPNDRLRVQLVWNGETILSEGRMRVPTGAAVPGKITTGIQFQNMEEDLKGRQNLSLLTHMVGEMQRQEVRRVRMGMMQNA